MRTRPEEDGPAQPTRDILTRERQDDPEAGPSLGTEPVAKPLVAFEALPVKTVVSRW
jgi:hypothetical protein